MKRSLSLSIPRPCHEQWKNFTPTPNGGFCANCQKEVIDFTTWDEKGIKDYFKDLAHPICGKFRLQQLKTYNFHENSAKRQNAWLPLSLLGCTLLFSSGCSDERTLGEPSIITTQTNDKTNSNNNPNQYSDSIEIRGVVLNYFDRTPISGATVILERTQQKIITDRNGRFTMTIINHTFENMLVIKADGYLDQEVLLPKTFSGELKVLLENYPEENYVKGDTVMIKSAATINWPNLRSFWNGVERFKRILNL